MVSKRKNIVRKDHTNRGSRVLVLTFDEEERK
jgi:hypothetical protein